MANNKNFKVKNGIKPTAYHEAVGTVVSSVAGYDLSVAAYDNKSFSVATEETNPYGIAFKSDGTKMYVAGNSGDDVSQYSLSTAWDVSTASFDSVTFALGTPGTMAPHGLFFKSDGTKMYVPFSSIADVREYDLSTAWDLSTASYNSVFLDMSSEMTGAGSIYIKSDGLTLFALDYIADVVYKYTLTTAWDLSTASYSSDSVSVASTGEALSYGLWFSDDGTKFIVAGDTNDKAYEFIMTTAWDITTASYSGTSFDLTTAGSTTAPTGIAFKPDGTKMYSAMRGDDTIYQYSTSYNSNTLDLSTGSVFEISPTSDIQIGLSNPAASGTVSAATLLFHQIIIYLTYLMPISLLLFLKIRLFKI
jgi:DNA-binding beta-propeller fold protein YncE